MVHPIGVATGIMGFAIVAIGLFWWAMATGFEEPWEPNLFLNLGALGILKYGVELNQLFQNLIVWSGVEVIFKLLRSRSFLYISAAFAVADLGSIFFTGIFADTSLARSIFFTGVSAGIGAGAGAGVFVVIRLARLSLDVNEFSNFSLSGFSLFSYVSTVAGCFYWSNIGLLTGLAIGAWYQCKTETENKWFKFFAVLALPWFCTAPIVLGFAGIELTLLFTSLKFLPIPPWSSAVLIELFLLVVCTWLWRWGQQREARARNPLRVN